MDTHQSTDPVRAKLYEAVEAILAAIDMLEPVSAESKEAMRQAQERLIDTFEELKKRLRGEGDAR